MEFRSHIACNDRLHSATLNTDVAIVNNCNDKLAKAREWKHKNKDKVREYNRKYREKNRAKVRAIKKAWRDSQPESWHERERQRRRCGKTTNRRRKASKANQWVYRLLSHARQASRDRGHPAPTIDSRWIRAQPLVCPYLGLKLIPPHLNSDKKEGKRHPNTPSLDRIDISKGYTPENTKLTSWFWNNARGDMSVEEALSAFDQVAYP